MRNSSDIFCLRDDVTDGTQMFSVNGSCPLRISRRQQHARENECFEYGRVSVPELCRGDQTYQEEDKPEEFNEETASLNDLESIAESVRGSARESTKGSTRQSTRSSAFGEPSAADRKSEGSAQFRKLDSHKNIDFKSQDTLSASNMTRNPLTGAGMETKEHKKPKKGKKKKLFQGGESEEFNYLESTSDAVRGSVKGSARESTTSSARQSNYSPVIGDSTGTPDQNSEARVQVNKLDRLKNIDFKRQDTLSASNISRNPLTGVGVETKEDKCWKKGKRKVKEPTHNLYM